MLSSHRRIVAALAMTIPLSMPAVSMSGSVAVAAAAPYDGLSGTWQIRRTCLTGCVSPNPVRKVVARLGADTFVTAGRPSQVLYRVGKRVLVHGPKDSLLLDIKNPGRLMSGFGVGANGSTFETTWVCVASAGSAAAAVSPTLTGVTATAPARAPMGMTLC